ncbi:hypothetical protein X971_2363 [Agrobacterium tumefaciens LBA4213 (Ach5)]|nr:hypothetical protein X971_2363 [Agrobacterium tumefaciens LBA4213 (Ach5)]
MPARFHAGLSKLTAGRGRRCDTRARADRKTQKQGTGGAEQPGSPAKGKVLMH